MMEASFNKWNEVKKITNNEDKKVFFKERDIFLGVPSTSTVRDGSFYCQFKLDGKMSTALLVQHKLFSSKIFMKKIGKIDDENFKKVFVFFRFDVGAFDVLCRLERWG